MAEVAVWQFVLIVAGWVALSVLLAFALGRLFRGQGTTVDEIAFANLNAAFNALPHPDGPRHNRRSSGCVLFASSFDLLDEKCIVCEK